MTDEEAYGALFGADLRKLPYGVLKAIYAGVRRELEIRRRDAAVQRKELAESAAVIEKKFAGRPKLHFAFSHHFLSYLPVLLDQDWSHLFPGGDKEQKYYVYGHFKPTGYPVRFVHKNLMIKSTGLPFYIGKGTGDRAFDMKRNQGHGEILRDLLRRGCSPQDIAFVVCDNLTEAEALEIESKLIYFFGTKYEAGRRGILVNLDIPPRPDLVSPK